MQDGHGERGSIDLGALLDDVGADGVERVPSSGSCARCGRALDLASAFVGGRWYGNAACAGDAACPLEQRPPAVPEAWLTSRPRRHFRRRLPKELRSSRR
jgi:hypothetical protein